MTKASEYGISVRLVVRDGEEMYEARVSELQDVLAFGDTYAEAYESAIEAVTGIQEMFAEKGKALPPPEQEVTDFSGRVTLRMSKSLHQCVHAMAARDGVSLNQWIVEAVGCRVSPAPVAPHAVPGAVYIVSPMRQSNVAPMGICFQQASVLRTMTMPSGPVSFLMTPGVVESGSVAPTRIENNQRHFS